MLSTARRRTLVLFVAATTLVVAVLGLGATVLVRNSNAIATQTAYHRAEERVDLVSRLGAAFQAVRSGLVAHEISPQARRELALAISGGRRRRVLSDLTIWDRSGHLVYRSSGAPEGRSHPSAAALAAALRGEAQTRTEPAVFDITLKKRSGLLDSLIPIRDSRGRVAAAMEVSLPLDRLVQEGQRIRSRVLAIVVVGGVALWLLLIPLTLRAARSAANDWIPGRGKTLRALRRGLRNGEVELAYQPQVDPRTGTPGGVEALIRWRRNGALLAPGAFLPAVETSPLMPQLTEHVLDLALRELDLLAPPEHELRLSVNVSARDLDDGGLPERVSMALRRHGVAPGRLTLEVTETAVMANEERAIEVLNALAGLGVELSVDDFGTGHSSLSRLQRLPLDELKIDRSFVSAEESRSPLFVGAIVGLARELGLRVVAEGVDEAATLGVLAEMGCDLAQGYHLSAPLDAEGIRDWLTRRRAAVTV